MDLGLLLTVLADRGGNPAPLPAGEPAARAVVWRGAVLPLCVPAEGLPLRLRARMTAARGDLPDADRVAALLDAGLDTDAWLLLDRRTEPIESEPRLHLRIDAWVRGRIGAMAGAACLLRTGQGLVASEQGAFALQDAQTLLANLPGRWWAGPLVVESEPLEAVNGLLPRAAMPVVVAPHERASIAAQAARIVLMRTGTPWPRWFEDGCAGLAARQAAGRPLGLRGSVEARAAAGRDAITAMLVGGRADPALAEAVAAVPLRPGRAALLADIARRLRAGASALDAFTGAGLPPARLAEQP